MRYTVLAALAALALAGCATPAPHGNYLPSATVDQQKLAGDAVKQLAALWPPARTPLELQQPTPDAFGAALVKGLRESGYALVEFNPDAMSASTARPLRYVLDRAGPANLYRLSVTVGSQSITRPYMERDGALVPAGYWVRQE